MAGTKKVAAAGAETIALTSAKVKKLVVKNFRGIGSKPVEIELDDIVVLVGPNNAGKSTILRAYEVVMHHGSTSGRLKLEDFPGEHVDENNLPEIELQTYVFENKPAEQWLHQDEETGQEYVRERWIWSSPDSEPKRQGHRKNAQDWDEKVPWGAPGVANSRRPIPHRVDAFASPEEQAEAISSLIKELLVERAKGGGEDSHGGRVTELRNQLAALQQELVGEAAQEIAEIEGRLTSIVSDVFSGFQVSLDPRASDVADKALSLFSASPVLRMGPEGGHLAKVDKQGSGARRTLLWSALKLLSERPAKPKGKAKKSAEDEGQAEFQRPHVLLMDEPEICLHPNAIREACRVLYGLAEGENAWQIMITTHSPTFIDLSRDNTTVVRVERAADGDVFGTTVFRPGRAKLDEDERKLLKLLNVWDPHVAEFFFGGRVVLVEGDTEYSAFRHLVQRYPDAFKDVHIVRARGKAILVPLIKIMNHFGATYSVLHDSDTPILGNGNKNSAWTMNSRIRQEIDVALGAGKARLVASCPNFELGVLNTSAKGEKPYAAVLAMSSEDDTLQRVRELLTGLTKFDEPLPDGSAAWNEIEELEKLTAAGSATA